jgi:hypothetical protein
MAVKTTGFKDYTDIKDARLTADDISFFFVREGSTDQIIQMPMNPETFEMPYNGDNETENIVNKGDVTVIRSPGLANPSIVGLLPSGTVPMQDLTAVGMTPHAYRDKFVSWMEDRQVVHFIVTGLSYNMLVTIEDASFESRGGEDDDLYYNIKLKEFREYGIVNPIKFKGVVHKKAKASGNRFKSGTKFQATECDIIKIAPAKYGKKGKKKKNKYRYKIKLTGATGKYKNKIGFVAAKQITR